MPQAQKGDIYRLGQHVLLVGSSTDRNDVEKLCGDVKAKLLFTSPPYSDMRTYESNNDLSVENISQFIKLYAEHSDIQAVNIGIQRKNWEINTYWDAYIKAARAIGLKLLAWNVWDKMMCGHISQQQAFIPIRHEWIFVFGEKPIAVNKTWKKKQNNIKKPYKRRVREKDGSLVLKGTGDTSETFKKMESVCKISDEELESVTEIYPINGEIRKKHPAIFPVSLPAEYILAMTNEGDTVIDPFGGSGSTLIACEQLKRKCRIMEIEPKYADVIIDRWQIFTGEKAQKIRGE